MCSSAFGEEVARVDKHGGYTSAARMDIFPLPDRRAQGSYAHDSLLQKHRFVGSPKCHVDLTHWQAGTPCLPIPPALHRLCSGILFSGFTHLLSGHVSSALSPLVLHLGLFNYMLKVHRGIFFFYGTVSSSYPCTLAFAWQRGRGEEVRGRQEGGEERRREERKRMKVTVGNKHERENRVNKNPGLVSAMESSHHFHSINEAFSFSQILNIPPKEAEGTEGKDGKGHKKPSVGPCWSIDWAL